MLPLEIQTDHEQAIREHGQRAYPHECCGILLGRDEPELRRILRIVSAVNRHDTEHQHHRFVISPKAFLEADKTARANQMEILGFYHSHPNALARPSAYDLEHAWPIYSYLIVSVHEGEPLDMTCWVLENDRSKFNEQPVVIA